MFIFDSSLHLGTLLCINHTMYAKHTNMNFHDVLHDSVFLSAENWRVSVRLIQFTEFLWIDSSDMRSLTIFLVMNCNCLIIILAYLCWKITCFAREHSREKEWVEENNQNFRTTSVSPNNKKLYGKQLIWDCSSFEFSLNFFSSNAYLKKTQDTMSS